MRYYHAVLLGLHIWWAPAPAHANDRVVGMTAIDASGLSASMGQIMIAKDGSGLRFTVDVDGVEDGDHGFHVHENGNCGAGLKDGAFAAGLAAGDHFDPLSTQSHQGPLKSGHKGDLPKLTAVSNRIRQTVTTANLSLDEIEGRSLMIHAGGDTYSDMPPAGGGGARIACGVIPKP